MAKVKRYNADGTVKKEFGFEDHKGIYSYADSSITQAPIKIIDATIQPPEVTSYPEYPIREFSSPPAFNVDRIPAAARRAKAILQMNLKKYLNSSINAL